MFFQVDPITNIGIEDFLGKLTLFGIPAVLIVIALVAIARQLGLGGKWTPLATVIAGAIVALLLGLVDIVPQVTPFVKYLVAAILLGLAGSGAYSLTKRVAGWETVPPKSVVQRPDGTVDKTDSPPPNPNM